MNVQVYSLYDTKALVFSQPSYFPNDATAMRAFLQLSNESGNTVNQYPADFIIFNVGEWDDQNGVLLALTAPRSLGPVSGLKLTSLAAGLGSK